MNFRKRLRSRVVLVADILNTHYFRTGPIVNNSIRAVWDLIITDLARARAGQIYIDKSDWSQSQICAVSDSFAVSLCYHAARVSVYCV